jgi:hypothetical protein
MIIATRILTLRDGGKSTEIPVHLHAPVRDGIDWSCKIELHWPGQPLTRAAVGVDAVQAIQLAMKMIGALLYTSEHHEAGRLAWLSSGQGYGFPVPGTIRDLLIGDDRAEF